MASIAMTIRVTLENYDYAVIEAKELEIAISRYLSDELNTVLRTKRKEQKKIETQSQPAQSREN